MTQEFERFDVAIIGAGVAACATAIALRKRYPDFRIVMVDRQLENNSEQESITKNRIGETLPAQAVVPLQRLGLWQGFIDCEFLAAHGSSASWGAKQRYYNEFITSPYGHGWHIDRVKFDRWLLKETQEQKIDVYNGRRIQRSEFRDDASNPYWFFYLTDTKNNRVEINASFVVDATGRKAYFAQQQGSKLKTDDKLVAIYRFLSNNNSTKLEHEKRQKNTDTTTLVESHTDGWWYSAVLPNNDLVLALMTDADIANQNHFRDNQTWKECLTKSEHTWQRVNENYSDDLSENKPSVIAAHSQSLDYVTGDAWLAVGDASTTYDPLSSLGIFKALRSGLYASFAISDYFSDVDSKLTKYQAIMSSEYQNYIQKRREYYAEEQRFNDAVFWQRRHNYRMALAS